MTGAVKRADNSLEVVLLGKRGNERMRVCPFAESAPDVVAKKECPQYSEQVTRDRQGILRAEKKNQLRTGRIS